jgi:hypothetical protein
MICPAPNTLAIFKKVGQASGHETISEWEHISTKRTWVFLVLLNIMPPDQTRPNYLIVNESFLFLKWFSEKFILTLNIQYGYLRSNIDQ